MSQIVLAYNILSMHTHISLVLRAQIQMGKMKYLGLAKAPHIILVLCVCEIHGYVVCLRNMWCRVCMHGYGVCGCGLCCAVARTVSQVSQDAHKPKKVWQSKV